MRKYITLLLFFTVFMLASCEGSNTVHTGLNPGMDTVEIHEVWNDAGAYLTIGELYVVEFSDDEVDTSILGEHTITYVIRYEEENYEIIRMVLVLDQTAPELTLLPGVDTVSQNDTWIDGGCEVTDNSMEELTCTTTSVVDTSVAGIYEVIYTAEDSSGNEGAITRIVTVVE